MTEDLLDLFFQFLKGSHLIKPFFKVFITKVSSVAILAYITRSLGIFFKE